MNIKRMTTNELVSACARINALGVYEVSDAQMEKYNKLWKELCFRNGEIAAYRFIRAETEEIKARRAK